MNLDLSLYQVRLISYHKESESHLYLNLYPFPLLTFMYKYLPGLDIIRVSIVLNLPSIAIRTIVAIDL
ncbi:hypothetical protein GLO73106DRAFT_00039630 [Gloeocapsa sp. PCC 73106]|nr:hypothetical protein GLO73106DRAFT_00039630 [Gloeocapsa sp. PCC 73106]